MLVDIAHRGTYLAILRELSRRLQPSDVAPRERLGDGEADVLLTAQDSRDDGRLLSWGTVVENRG